MGIEMVAALPRVASGWAAAFIWFFSYLEYAFLFRHSLLSMVEIMVLHHI